MIRWAGPSRSSVAVGAGWTARAQEGAASSEQGAGGPMSEAPAPTTAPSVGDFVGLLVAIVVVVAIAWSVARWARKAPTRGVRAAVRKAKRLNEAFDGHDMPHPVPEMEMRRRAEAGPTADSQLRVGRGSAGDGPARPAAGGDAAAREAVDRLAHILSHPDEKDIRADYAKLDALVRRYLFARYGVKAFSATAASLLNSLPQDLTDSVVDYAGEILRVCEVAELRGHRPSRGELRHLCGLAYEFITGHDTSATDDEGTEIPE